MGVMIKNQPDTAAEKPAIIAIVGCGASGVITLNYLVQCYEQQKTARPLRIHIFEKSKTPGVGIAYGTDNDEHILNMRNGTVDIFPDKPGHFMNWLKANVIKLNLSQKAIDFDGFLPRRIIGLYLKECLENSLQHAKKIGIAVTFIHEEVDNLYETQTKQRLSYKDTHLDADYTVFCLGNLPSTNYPEFYNVPEYFHTPWHLSDKVKGSSKPIGILGASLSAIDTLISLAPTTSGPLYFISPNGRLPKVLHIRKPFTPRFVTTENIRLITHNFNRKIRLSEGVGLFKQEIEAASGKPIDWSQIWQIDNNPLTELKKDIARAERGENHWHTVLADTSPLLPLIWENLDEKDKKTFYSHYYKWWRIYRVSMPLQNAKKVLQLLESGRLSVIRNLRSVKYDNNDKTFAISHGQDDSLRVAYLINATGTGFDVVKSQSKLMQNLIRNDLLSPHPMGGVDVNPTTLRLIKKDGTELPRIFFFGMLTKGVHFYTNDLSVNATHAESVARTIIDAICAAKVYPAIPLSAGHVTGWKNIPIKKEYSDPLVPLGLLSREAVTIATSSLYFGEHSNSPYREHTLAGSLLTLFARQSVARRLVAAERLLPSGYHLLVFDAYRPYHVQESLYNFYKQKLQEKHPTMDNDALESNTQAYVSLPSRDPARPSPHNTGGAVDVAIIKLNYTYEAEVSDIHSQLADNTITSTKRIGLELRLSTIIRHHGVMLDFGTPLDHGGEKSALTFYESKIAAGEILTDDEEQACDNRRLLFRVMTQTGFQPYFAEWWHFNAPESQMGAATAGRDCATYSAIELNTADKVHETTRRALNKAGDPDLRNNWPAEIIAPT
jgi:uncharacterized NAD(P)/FAD-binding protein YdhS/D-alanyl-D-alanine dipeptidase